MPFFGTVQLLSLFVVGTEGMPLTTISLAGTWLIDVIASKSFHTGAQ